MKIPAKNPEITYDVDGNMRITFTTPYKLEDIAGELDELRDKDIDLTIERHRKKRSLDANAYCWVLIGRLAEKMRISRETIYREAIRDIGGNYYTICAKDQNEASVYDTAQMSRLIDRITDDCKDQHIDTKPPEEIEALVKAWGVK